jgi:hypothetical protein
MSGESNLKKYGVTIALNRLYRLFKQADDRIIELRISRGTWFVPFDGLADFSILAARKLARRALDRLYNCDLIAVGVFKVSVRQTNYEVVLHLIASGATIAELRSAFACVRPERDANNRLRARQVNSVGQAMKNLLNLDGRRRDNNPGPAQVSKKGGTGNGWRTVKPVYRPNELQRREYSEWLASLTPPGLLFRYGCDRHFNAEDASHNAVKNKEKASEPRLA